MAGRVGGEWMRMCTSLAAGPPSLEPLLGQLQARNNLLAPSKADASRGGPVSSSMDVRFSWRPIRVAHLRRAELIDCVFQSRPELHHVAEPRIPRNFAPPGAVEWHVEPTRTGAEIAWADTRRRLGSGG